MPEVDLVVDPAAAGNLAQLLAEREAGLLPEKIVRPPQGGRRVVSTAAVPDAARTRAFLKIQDGCERRCAFCIVPFLRGPERSAESGALEDEIRRLGESGVPEVVLAGVHLANYGKDRGSSLLALLRRLEDAPLGCRIRLSSLEPMEAGDALLDFVATSRTVVPHLHLPLQSGSDAVLRRMRRGITTARFRAFSDRVLSANPRLHLATDLIVGFPGESDAEFEETVHFVRAIPFGSLHVFPFSPRRGTRGAELHAVAAVRPAAVTRRAAQLRRLGEEKARAFRRTASGTVADAVVLRGGVALTDHYLEAALRAPLHPGARLPVRLEAAGPAASLSAFPASEAGRIPLP
jgi:threonylcarbamoyladenosine tRNA methylthiotransferase MtaB